MRAANGLDEQFVELAHDGECVEHLAGDVRGLLPVSAAEGALRHPLASAKAVVYRAATKAALPEVRMDAAPEGRLQVGTGLSGRLADREAENAGAVQQSAKHRSQSARSVYWP